MGHYFVYNPCILFNQWTYSISLNGIIHNFYFYHSGEFNEIQSVKTKLAICKLFTLMDFFNLKSYITWKTSLPNIKSTAFPFIHFYRGIYVWLTLWETCFFFLDFFLCFFFSLSSWSDSGWLRFFFSRSRSSWSESGMLLGDRERDSERVFFFFFDLCLEEDLTEAVSLSDSLPYKNQTEATMSDELVHKA